MKFSFIEPWLKRPQISVTGDLPEAMMVLVQEIARKSSQSEALRYAYDILSKKYRGYRILTFLRLDQLCITDMELLWQKKGFLHCHHINYLFRIVLIVSGKFAPEDIEARWTQVWLFSPHQYLLITLESGEKVEIDLWGRAYGIPFGAHAHGFRSGSLFAKMRQ